MTQSKKTDSVPVLKLLDSKFWKKLILFFEFFSKNYYYVGCAVIVSSEIMSINAAQAHMKPVFAGVCSSTRYSVPPSIHEN